MQLEKNIFFTNYILQIIISLVSISPTIHTNTDDRADWSLCRNQTVVREFRIFQKQLATGEE